MHKQLIDSKAKNVLLEMKELLYQCYVELLYIVIDILFPGGF